MFYNPRLTGWQGLSDVDNLSIDDPEEDGPEVGDVDEEGDNEEILHSTAKEDITSRQLNGELEDDAEEAETHRHLTATIKESSDEEEEEEDGPDECVDQGPEVPFDSI